MSEDWISRGPCPRTVLSGRPPSGVPPACQTCQLVVARIRHMRVGFWRIRDALRDRGIIRPWRSRRVCDEIIRAFAEACAGARLGVSWVTVISGPMHKHDDQQEQIDRAVLPSRSFSGKKCAAGKARPDRKPSRPIDFLRRAGGGIVADWLLDDQPVEIETNPMVRCCRFALYGGNQRQINHDGPCSSILPDEMFKRSERTQLTAFIRESEHSARVM